MKNLKKVFVMMMVLAMTLSGCGNSKETSNSKKDDTAEATATPTVEATTSPVTEEATTAETKTAQLYVSLDGNALPDKTYDYTGDLTAEVLGKGLSELTGLYFDFKSEKNGKDIIIDWSMEDGLLSDGDPQKMGNFFGAVWPEYGTQQWFMMDSLWYTLTNNLDVENVYFTMDGGQELRIEGILSDTDTFPSDVPYMGSGFYMAHDDVKGDSDNDSSLEAWNSVSGTYGREDSDQFNIFPVSF